MTRAVLEAVTCDRCGEGRHFTVGDPERGEWPQIICYQTPGQNVFIGTCAILPTGSSDMCPQCLKQLMQWWAGAPIAQPPKPTPFIPLASENPQE